MSKTQAASLQSGAFSTWKVPARVSGCGCHRRPPQQCFEVPGHASWMLSTQRSCLCLDENVADQSVSASRLRLHYLGQHLDVDPGLSQVQETGPVCLKRRGRLDNLQGRRDSGGLPPVQFQTARFGRVSSSRAQGTEWHLSPLWDLPCQLRLWLWWSHTKAFQTALLSCQPRKSSDEARSNLLPLKKPCPAKFALPVSFPKDMVNLISLE
jgi:hypothetical protein